MNDFHYWKHIDDNNFQNIQRIHLIPYIWKIMLFQQQQRTIIRVGSLYIIALLQMDASHEYFST